MGNINYSCERVIFRLRQLAPRVVCYGNGWWCAKGCIMLRQHLKNCLVTQLFRPHRNYAQTYSDDIFVHSCAEKGRLDVGNHIGHLRAVLECMRTSKVYASASKWIFGAEEIPFLRCFIGKRGLRADPAKVKNIVDRPIPKNQKDLR